MPATAGLPPTAGSIRASDGDRFAAQFANEPLAAIIYTDIATDGMMRGPNVEAMADMQAAVDGTGDCLGRGDDGRRRRPAR